MSKERTAFLRHILLRLAVDRELSGTTQGMSAHSHTWLPPDPAGLSTVWLAGPARSTLHGKRLRRAFDRPAPLLDTWLTAWRKLLRIGDRGVIKRSCRGLPGRPLRPPRRTAARLAS